ncbi:tetratricopeptide repeat-containing diguanylate cyclase [Ureibacillus chungkukjangi]|uniref:Diguanylate cyclase (GGDEF)-like protein n=1 Tax=Ureibacillus chungkukjangi TaxID=1202712 RepID=A0A318TNP3_9BACL|nr:tetratricopeptide repeat-containing diguanylate cyclase [Ureibacillus chungkukjangi]PYF06023.1 diguanylate cyclase (GGDEF)-like protein [Ureibacillus chungkukjangi]
MQELEELKITMEALVREDRFNEFLNLFEPTASLALQEKNYNLLIDLYIKRSKIYFILGDIQSCIGDLKKVTEWIDEHGADGQKTIYLNMYATVCGELGNQKKNFEYLNKAKALATKLDDILTLCKIYNNLGVYYLVEEEPANAVEHLQKGLDLSKKLDDSNEEELIVLLKLNLAKAYTNLGEFIKAEELFDFLFDYIDGKQWMKTSIYVLQYKGLWFKAQQRFEEANEILVKAKDFASKNNDLILLEEINNILLEVVTELNDKDLLIAIQRDYINILLKIKEININQNLLQIEMTQNEKQFESISTKDPLTTCYNRRYFEKNIKKWLKEANMTAQLIGFFILDVDYFKQINDQFGHLVGDDVLKSVANMAAEYLSAYDSIFARYGGDEFVAMVKVSSKDELIEIVDNLYNHISDTIIELDEEKISISISLGVSTNVNGMLTDYKEIFKLADDALYESKRNGRNQYTVNT